MRGKPRVGLGALLAQLLVVIARAGATTVAELGAVGRPAILLPYPLAADNHQEKNAAALAASGAALVFRQSELDGEKLAAAIRGLMKDRGRLARMAEAMRGQARPDAAAEIVSRLYAMGKSGDRGRTNRS